MTAPGTTVTVPANASYSGSATVFEALSGGKIVTLGPVTLNSTGVSAYGAYAHAKGVIELNGGSVDTSAFNARGLNSADKDSSIAANDLAVRTLGQSAHGVFAGTESKIIFNGGSVETTGNFAVGIDAAYSATIDLGQGTSGNFTHVVTNGTSAHGIYASHAAIITGSAVTVTTNGGGAFGVFTGDVLGGVVTLDGATILTKGIGSFGAQAFRAGSLVTLTGGSITTLGANAVSASGQEKGKLTLTGTVVTTSGNLAHGLEAYDSGTVNASNSVITTKGAGAAAIHSLFGFTADPNIVNVTGGRLISEAGDLIQAQNGVLNVTVQGPAVTGNGSGNVLNALNSVVNFTARDVTLTGDLVADNSSTANVDLFRSNLTGAAKNATNISLDGTSVWNLTAASSVSQNVNNSGQIQFSPPAVGGFKALTVAGNYAGNGGTILLNTYLGDDTSATDQLVAGSTSGASILMVVNAGGPGAPTIEGIKVINVSGASGGTFELAGNYVFQGQQAVVAGAYAYRLYKNGITDPSDGDWYLRSALNDTPVVPVVPVNPLFQAGVPIYEVYAQTLLGLNGLPTLQQREGDRYWIGPGSVPLASEAGAGRVDQNVIWTRIEGSHVKAEPKTSTSATDYKYDTWKIQSGLDGLFYEGDQGWLIGGINLHYGNVSADIVSDYGNGTIKTDGYGVAGTLTWYGQNGFYVDGQAQATWFNSNLRSNLTGVGLVEGNNGFGYAFSLETGKRIELDPHWTLTPQAQLAYSAVDFHKFTDPFGGDISLDKGDSLKSRLGVSADYKSAWADKNGKAVRTNLYGIANLYYEFLNGTQVDVAQTKLINANERFWGGIGTGGSYNWSDGRYSIFGEVSVNTSLADFGSSYSLN